MTGYEPPAIPGSGENAWNWRHAEIVAAFTSLEVTDAAAQADRFERIAAWWAAGLDAFERAIWETLATAWAGIGAEAAGAAVSVYVAQARELTPALAELPGLVRAAAEAIVATKYAIPERVADEAEPSMSPASGAATHRAAADAEESARAAMRARYVVPFGAIDGRIPLLPVLIHRGGPGRRRVLVGSADGGNALSAGTDHRLSAEGDHALSTGGDHRLSAESDHPLSTGDDHELPGDRDHTRSTSDDHQLSTEGDHPPPTSGDHRLSTGGDDGESSGDAANGAWDSSAATGDQPLQVSSPSAIEAEDDAAAIGESATSGMVVAEVVARESVGDAGSDVESAAVGSGVVSSSSGGVSNAPLAAAPSGPGFPPPGGPGMQTAHAAPALPGTEAPTTSLGRTFTELGGNRPGSNDVSSTASGDRPSVSGTAYRSAHNGALVRPDAGRSVPGAVGPVIGANPPTVPAPSRVFDRLFHYAGPLGPAQAPIGETERGLPEYLITQANTEALLGNRRPAVAGGVIGGADDVGPDAQHASSARA